jgi:hypothetical protein
MVISVIFRKIRTAFIVFTIALMVLCLSVGATDAQSDIVVHQAIEGQYVRAVELDQSQVGLGLADTAQATWGTLELPFSDRSRPFWSPSGRYISLSLLNAQSGILDLQSGSVNVETDNIAGTLSPFDLSYVVGWSTDEQDVVYNYFQFNVGEPDTIGALYKIGVGSNNALELMRYQSGEPPIGMPLPPNATSVTITGSNEVERNPVFDNWFLMLFRASGFYSTFQSDQPSAANINVLWNSETNQFISLDALVPDLMISPVRTDWNHDGTRLLLSAVSIDLRDNYILTFRFTPESGVELVERDIVAGRIPEHWLDAGDLFFSLIQDYEGGAAYVLGEIVNGAYREMPFFTLNGEQFDMESSGDWNMQASISERHRLSCLFEWSLPTRLNVGASVQVVADDGVGLRLRAEPDRFSPQVGLLDEGSIAMIIGGSACSGGYRWWQLELGDGATGWAAEADASAYFLQLPEQPMSTSTTTDTPSPPLHARPRHHAQLAHHEPERGGAGGDVAVLVSMV